MMVLGTELRSGMLVKRAPGIFITTRRFLVVMTYHEWMASRGADPEDLSDWPGLYDPAGGSLYVAIDHHRYKVIFR